MKHLAAVLFTLGCTSAFAGPDLLYGSWEGGDTAAMSVYGFLHISEGSISWGREARRPECKADYTLVAEPAGVSFKDQTDHEFTTGPNSRFQSYLLKIRPSKCAGDLGYLRLTVDPGFSSRYLAMVEYSPEQREQGWMHFFKR